MEWIVFLGLGVWVWLQSRRIGALTRKLTELEHALARVAPGRAPAAPEAMRPAPVAVPPPPHDLETLLLDNPLAPDELLLDTPLPEASNDAEAEPLAVATPSQTPTPPPATEPAEPRAARAPNRKFEQWLAENAFAWLGGGAFALGAIFLVSFVAQQNWFTPQARLICALILGAGLIGASEWARRVTRARPPGHPLVAALLAGAGVVAFYATAWAAHGVYHFVSWPTAAALLTACALILVGLALLHGEALGVLAIAAALLAPALTNAPLWPSFALTLYIGAVGAAGFGLAALRRWAWVAIATSAGLYFWFWAAIAADEVRRALALLSFASLGGVMLALRTPIKDEAADWTRVRTLGPSIAVSISSALLILAWLAVAPASTGRIAGPALIGVFHVALAAYAVRARVAAPAALVVAISALVVGFMAYLRARFFFGPLGIDVYPTLLFASLTVAVSALGARPHRTSRALVAASGAIGAALLAVLASFSRADWHAITAWAPLLSGAALSLVSAHHTERDAKDPRNDRAIDFWAGAGAALVLLAIESAIPAEMRAFVSAAAALLFAAGLALRGWRVLRYATLTAAAITLAHALSPSLVGAALNATLPLWGALLILAGAAALLFAAAYVVRTDANKTTSEALTSAGVFTALIAAFLTLRWFATGRAGAPLDGFTETSLRVLTLLAAGHLLLPRPGQELGWISRWRGHALMGLGLLYALFFPGLMLNPWWGVIARPAIIGPLLLDTLLLAFAAPAALALTAANRLYDRQRTPARLYASAGGMLALTWAVLAVRRLFHSAQMSTAPVGLFEGACYALLFLIAALAVALAARIREARNGDRPFTHDLMRITRGSAWAGLVAATYTMLLLRHPWWGAQNGAASDGLSTGLAVLAQPIAMALALMLGRALSRSRDVEPARFATASAALLFAWSFGHAALRWLYHHGAMDDGPAFVGLEGYFNAVWPLAFVLAGSAIASRTPGRDSVRAYLHDLQAIFSVAIWPTLAFAGLGLWFVFNPWWGPAPARIATIPTAIVALGLSLIAAWLSTLAPRIPFARFPNWLAPAATIAAVGHLFIAATLSVRWLHHRIVMDIAPAGEIEMWIYSAVWALFGAGVFGLGMRRNDLVLRWSGLAILLGTTAFVFYLTLTRLTGVAQFGSMLGLAAVLMAVAWLARANRSSQPPGPGDLLNITPSARRERRHGRRQRSS